MLHIQGPRVVGAIAPKLEQAEIERVKRWPGFRLSSPYSPPRYFDFSVK
jgi:hypothetical protein